MTWCVAELLDLGAFHVVFNGEKVYWLPICAV
jgi:hypothetical protein